MKLVRSGWFFEIRFLLTAYRSDLDLAYVRAEFATVADANDQRWAKLDAWINEQRDE
jgi:hypothetical protein